MGGDETVDNDSDSECEWETLTGEEKLRELSEDDLGAIIRLDGDGPITSDWHIPLTNFSLARQMTEDCERRSMGSWLVIAGDLFHQDGLNRFEQKQQGARFETEISVANRVVKKLLQTFDRVYVTLGNHDVNLQRRLDYAATFETTVKMILHELGEDDQRRIIVTPRDHLIIDTEEGPWRVCHTKTYRKSQLAYVAALADLHRMNVAAGHRHHCALGFSPSGYRIAELGGMHDRLKTDYLNRWTSDHPLHQSGYMLLRRGRVVCPALSG